MDVVGIMRLAAPHLPVDRVRGSGKAYAPKASARMELRDSRSVKFAYLELLPGGEADLLLYPADTLEQARHLYRDPTRTEQLLGLQQRGWDLRPNFHFAYAEKGLTWTQSEVPIDAYVAYWEHRIDGLGVIRREDWDRELEILVADRIMAREDLSQFHADFTWTQREDAIPRPGLRLSRRWPSDEVLSDLFAAELRKALRAAVTALGEYQLATELAGPA